MDHRNVDPSQYVQIRLTVHRYGAEGLSYGIVIRTVGGGLRRDQMRARGVVSLPLDSAALADPVKALQAVIHSLGPQH